MNKTAVHTGKNSSSIRISVVGGSNSVMRNGYLMHMQRILLNKQSINVDLRYYSLGAVNSIFGLIQNARHDIAADSDVIIFEFGINDRSFAKFYSKRGLAFIGRSIEGFVRKVRSVNPNCRIVFIILGNNEDWYYDEACMVTAVYEAIAKRYGIHCIDTTELIIKKKGIDHLRQLYPPADTAHHTQPEGVKYVANIIAEEIMGRDLLAKQDYREKIYRLYKNNFENLDFFNRLDTLLINGKYECEEFSRSIFRENVYVMHPGTSFSFFLKGRLFAFYILSTEKSGVLTIRYGDRSYTASTYGILVGKRFSGILSLLTMPLDKPIITNQPVQFFVEVNKGQPKEYDLPWHMKPLITKQEECEVRIIGFAYSGKIYKDQNEIGD